MMLRRAVQESPGCDGVVLGGHGLFTWGDTQQECYENTIAIIDQLGQFVADHVEKKGAALFGGPHYQALENRRDLALDIFPFCVDGFRAPRRLIGNFSDLPEVLRFCEFPRGGSPGSSRHELSRSLYSHQGQAAVCSLAAGRKCEGTARANRFRAAENYRKEYAEYYKSFARPDSPAMRDANPTVVLIPGIGMFSFGKSKTEARLTGEFYVNAIHVMEGATSLGTGTMPEVLPQAGAAAPTSAFNVHSNYVALPPSEAFRIEYWQLEEAKDPPAACGKRIKPPGGVDCRRRQRNRP